MHAISCDLTIPFDYLGGGALRYPLSSNGGARAYVETVAGIARPAESDAVIVTPERWKQVQESLDIAIALVAKDRESFLRQIGDTDLELRQEVESLLSCESNDPDFLQRPALDSLAQGSWQEPRGDLLLGRVFAPYRLAALLGAGGMGDVYRAVRVDGQYEQQVALKVVRSDYAGGLTTRLRNERQILANLDHPNIARILDGGTTEDGIPYLVMELIEGLPITEYCDQHKLSIDDRLKLFRTLCSAVHYAHQHLVVHRDIKPSNILVTAEGTPKLLDFGIAKILRTDSIEHNATRTGFLMMTPEYASPEQLRGEPITTATDIYSLGVVLYELMTGCSAFRRRGNMPHEIARGVLEMEPERPSEAVRRDSGEAHKSGVVPSIGHTPNALPEKLSRLLAGDLDSIVLKALRKEPRNRYSSVDQLSEDIRRHLESLPVLAHEGALSYRVSKYVLRHKAGVASAALILLTLVIGVVLTVREARIAQSNELRAERRFNDVRKLANSLLFDIHDSIKDLPGSTPARKLIVQNALQYLDSLSAETAGDTSLERELATAYERVGEVQGHFLLSNLGEAENALQSYEKAFQLRKDLASPTASSWKDKLAVARCSRLVAVQLQAMGKVHDGLENIQAGISQAESIRKEHPKEVSILDELSREYEINGYFHRGGGVFAGVVDPEGEAGSYRKAIAVDEDWLKVAPSSSEAQHALAWDQMDYADTLGPENQNEALLYYQHALEITKQIATHTPSIQRARDIAVAYNKIGMFYDRKGDYANGLKSHRNALKVSEELVFKDPQNKHVVVGLAVDRANVSDDLLRMDQLKESKVEIAKAIGLMEGLVRESPANVSQQIMLSEMHVTRARILRRSNDPAAALSDYKFALSTYRRLLENDNSNTGPHLNVATCSIGMGKTELQLHRLDEASASFRTAVESLKLLTSTDRPDPRLVYISADAFADLGEVEETRAIHAGVGERRSRWEAARNWFRLSLEELNKVPQLINKMDDDIGPVDRAEVKKELSHCEAALRQVSR